MFRKEKDPVLLYKLGRFGWRDLANGPWDVVRGRFGARTWASDFSSFPGPRSPRPVLERCFMKLFY